MEEKEQKETDFLVDDDVAMLTHCWQRTKECRGGCCSKCFCFSNCLKTTVIWGSYSTRTVCLHSSLEKLDFLSRGGLTNCMVKFLGKLEKALYRQAVSNSQLKNCPHFLE